MSVVCTVTVVLDWTAPLTTGSGQHKGMDGQGRSHATNNCTGGRARSKPMLKYKYYGGGEEGNKLFKGKQDRSKGCG